MKKIIEPVDVELLKAQLSPDKMLRTTNRGDNEIYVVTNENAPDVLREIGRLREEVFRVGGGGTGKELDLDKFDTDPAYGYKQLVLWDPEANKIMGGYRYVLCDEAVYDKFGQPILTSSHMFEFSRRFKRKYLDHTIELGRSFVALEYQSSKVGSKSIFALDNLFDGLGALMEIHKDRMQYFFGKMTIYQHYPTQAREMIQVFLSKWFGAPQRNLHLIKIRKPIVVRGARKYLKFLTGTTFKDDYKCLKTFVMSHGVSIPPLVNSYMNLSPSMHYYGTGLNDEFGDVLDSGILIEFSQIYDDKRLRHIESFRKNGVEKLMFRLRRKF